MATETKPPVIPQIPDLPRGWTLVKFARGVQFPREAVVLCQRTGCDVADQDYVCWQVNMVEGGCHIGVYGDLHRATNSFNERERRLR